MKSFFEKLKAAIAAMWKHAPAEEVAIASTVNYVVPIVEGIDEMVVPEFAPILNPILDKVKTALSALKVTILDAENTATGKANAKSLIASVNANLATLVAAAQVKDAALAQKIQASATLVTGELNAIGL